MIVRMDHAIEDMIVGTSKELKYWYASRRRPGSSSWGLRAASWAPSCNQLEGLTLKRSSPRARNPDPPEAGSDGAGTAERVPPE